jgi:hypothetical protein
MSRASFFSAVCRYLWHDWDLRMALLVAVGFFVMAGLSGCDLPDTGNWWKPNTAPSVRSLEEPNG